VLPTGHGRVAPISRDDVAAAVAAVAAKPNKSRIICMITGHRALGFGEIAASYGETIVRQVRYRPCSQIPDLGVGASRRSLALCLLHLVRLNRRRSLQSGLQGLHCHYGPRTRSEPARSTRPWPADRVEHWPIEQLLPYTNNPRLHSEADLDKIAAAILKWGWTMPVLADEQGVLLAGAARVGAAAKLGLNSIPVIVARGWSEAEKRAYRLADNQIGGAGELGPRAAPQRAPGPRVRQFRPRSDRLRLRSARNHSGRLGNERSDRSGQCSGGTRSTGL
jgi:ParB-like nuclease domain